jgi:hypothetical protein
MNSETAAQREMKEHAEAERRQKRAEFIRKKEQYERNISRGMSIRKLNAYQMRRVEKDLSGLFRGELNLILEEMMPRSDEHREWAEFERPYEECMHRIREHILLAIGRDSNRRYGNRRVNPKLQAAAETLTGIRQVR